MKINVGVSNRHVHLKQEDFDILFGRDQKLEKFKDLSQPGEYASTLKLIIKTEKDIIDDVRVIGPIRNYTQVEISKTDAFKLGINPPIRNSGDIVGSAGVTLVGPKGTIELKEGCIIANRHIHITDEEIEKYGLVGKTKVRVKVDGPKGGILDNVMLKKSNNYIFELHIDTDDANAHLIKQGDIVEIIEVE
ncbi:MAG: phosphate propanoyltransferase [Ignavibacteriales bacterium]